LVYSARGHEVETVIIDGKIIMEERKILTVDEKQVIQQAQEAAERISQRSREDIITNQSDILKIMEEGYL
jgi:5-methylthioadenosine/S-adenosylhomocysteine deaminase